MFCSQCGKELEENTLVCPKCGAGIGKRREDKDVVENTKKNRIKEEEVCSGKNDKENRGKHFKLYVLIGSAVIAVILIMALAFFYFRGKKPETEDAKVTDTQEVSGKEIKEDDINEEEYIFPYSDKEYLTDADMESLTEEQLGFARNEIFARHGRIFTEEKYKEYFEEKSWYKGTVEPEVFDSNYEKELNKIEKANVEVIKNYEEKLKAFALAEQYYASVLKEYQDAEAGGYSGDASQYPHVNSLLFGNGCSEPLYFTLSDLCGDGIPELFIGYFLDGDSSNYILMELYGYEAGSAKQLSVSAGFGVTPLGEQNFIGERVRYYICDNGLIRENGSGGADINNVTYYELRENSVEMTIKEGAGQDGGHYFEQDYGGLGVLETTKAFYEEMQNKYPLKSDMQWYKLQELEGYGLQIGLKLENDTGAEENFDAEACYENILQQYRAQKGMLMTGGDDDFTETYPNVNMNVFGGIGEIPAGLSYALIDIDGNGMEELFIADVAEGNPASYTTYDIYTCIQGTPQRLFDVGDMGIQSFYFVCTNNIIMKIQKENGSAWYGTLFYQLAGESAGTKFVDGVWVYPGSSLGSMYSRSEECMADDGEEVDKAYYDTLVNTYPVKENIEWMKL